MTEGSGTGYRLTGNPLIKVSGNISFGIQAIDKQNDTDKQKRHLFG